MIIRILRVMVVGVGIMTACTGLALADSPSPDPGMVTIKTTHSYATLIGRLDSSTKENKMGLVTRASATIGAKKALNKKIPGNMVIGVFHPRFAVRMLQANVAAGIEAPLRFYITENDDKTATLTYRKPSSTFAPYKTRDLDMMARELDVIFMKIAIKAAGN
jgi:uncharacterized protein (DUF302 family)